MGSAPIEASLSCFAANWTKIGEEEQLCKQRRRHSDDVIWSARLLQLEHADCASRAEDAIAAYPITRHFGDQHPLTALGRRDRCQQRHSRIHVGSVYGSDTLSLSGVQGISFPPCSTVMTKPWILSDGADANGKPAVARFLMMW